MGKACDLPYLNGLTSNWKSRLYHFCFPLAIPKFTVYFAFGDKNPFDDEL